MYPARDRMTLQPELRGTTYYIVVDGFVTGTAAAGNFTLSVS